MDGPVRTEPQRVASRLSVFTREERVAYIGAKLGSATVWPRNSRCRATYCALAATGACHTVKNFLTLRSLLFLILIPGTVAGYIPLRILRASNQLSIPSLSAGSLLAGCLTLLGASVLLRCVWDFLSSGRGTLAPFDPPELLVVRGLYRLTRNPMYNGVLTVLVSQAWLFRNTALLQYTILMFIIFHLVVVVYEEPTLESRFGESYRAYRRAVPRWGFTARPFKAAA